MHVPDCLLVPPSPTLETNRHFKLHLSELQELEEETSFYRSLVSSQIAPRSAEGAVSSDHIAANQIGCVFAHVPLSGSSYPTVSSQI